MQSKLRDLNQISNAEKTTIEELIAKQLTVVKERDRLRSQNTFLDNKLKEKARMNGILKQKLLQYQESTNNQNTEHQKKKSVNTKIESKIPISTNQPKETNPTTKNQDQRQKEQTPKTRNR